MATPQQIIELLGLVPLRGKSGHFADEGGLFIQTYCSPETISHEHLPERYQEDRPFGTAIFYFLTAEADSFSALHKLLTDEIYHFYLGDPVELLQLYPDGTSERIILGQDILSGQKVQYLAPHGAWQGSHLIPGGKFALMGTTMAPGYTPEDYVGGDVNKLVTQYPGQADLIKQLTRQL